MLRNLRNKNIINLNTKTTDMPPHPVLHSTFQDTKIIDELDFVNLAPRKPDWDLKRDIAK